MAIGCKITELMVVIRVRGELLGFTPQNSARNALIVLILFK